MGFRRAAKVDANQMQMVRELRAQGYRVDIVSQLKKLYDLVVTGRMSGSADIRTVRVEVKTEEGKLTPDEIEYHRAEPYPETLIVARSSEDVLDWFGCLTSKNYLKSADTFASADAENKDMTHITPLSTISSARAKRNTKNSTTRETLS